MPWMRAALRWTARAVTLLGFLVLLVTVLPPTWCIAWLAGPWTNSKGNVLIVLAGEGIDEQMLGQNSYWRSVYAVWAWREGSFQKVLLSGESKVTHPMRDFLVSQGVPSEAIVIEAKSRSTHENAEMAVPILRTMQGPYVLMTSDFHMWRAHRAFTHAGIRVEPRPVPDAGKRAVQWNGRWPVFLELIKESTKIGYYKLRGWI